MNCLTAFDQTDGQSCLRIFRRNDLGDFRDGQACGMDGADAFARCPRVTARAFNRDLKVDHAGGVGVKNFCRRAVNRNCGQQFGFVFELVKRPGHAFHASETFFADRTAEVDIVNGSKICRFKSSQNREVGGDGARIVANAGAVDTSFGIRLDTFNVSEREHGV